MSLSLPHDGPVEDADLRFDLLIGKPTAAITLVTAVVLTAIIWISTFLITVSSVAAYVSRAAAPAHTGEPLDFDSSPASFPVAAATVAAARDKDLPVDEPLQVSPTVKAIGGTQQAPVTTPAVTIDQPVPPTPTPTQISDARAEIVAMPPARTAQDQGTSAEQTLVADNTAVRADPSQKQCPDGFWGNVCKERMRWSYCHPDKWDAVPECVVQKFDSALQ